MADYCSSGVWDEDGVNIDIDSLPIHFWLKTMITEWQAKFDREASNESTFDVQTFSKQGYALAVKLKQNLPDWKVMYFDEGASWEFRSQNRYLREIIL